MNRLAKAAAIGTTAMALLTIVIQIAARAFGQGESGWFLMLPWLVVHVPAVMLALVFGVDCRVGDIQGVHAGLFAWMLLVNALIGAVLGLIFGALYRVFKHHLTRPLHSTPR
jgi:hypothetical protein